MTTIELTGVVDRHGECENGFDAEAFGVSETVGGRCVSCAIDSLAPRGTEKLVLTLAHGGDGTLYEGPAYADHGMRGYSELTPEELPTIEVGGADLRQRLEELDGQAIHLRIDSED